MNIQWPQERHDRLRHHYESGLEHRQIAELMGTTLYAVSSQISKLGLGNRNHPSTWDEEKKELVKRLYIKEGRSYSQIAEVTGATRSAVGSVIKRMGIIREPTGPRKGSARDDLARRAKIREIAVKHAVYVAPAKPAKTAVVVVDPKRLSFEEMNFGKFCAFPVNDEGAPISYCGHDRGVIDILTGAKSSYCLGHHRVTHK